MPEPPQLTSEQREDALAKAAEARRARAELKEKLKMGSMSLRDLLAQADDIDLLSLHLAEEVPWEWTSIYLTLIAGTDRVHGLRGGPSPTARSAML